MENPMFGGKKQWFPVDFPFNQSIDCHDFPKTFGIITCFEHSQVMWVLVFVIQPFQITQPKYIYNSRFMIYNCSTNYRNFRYTYLRKTLGTVELLLGLPLFIVWHKFVVVHLLDLSFDWVVRWTWQTLVCKLNVSYVLFKHG